MMVRGFLLNNQLTDFSLAPEVGGAQAANRVEPDKRPRSSMAPTLVFERAGVSVTTIDLSEILGANVFKVNAFRKAARAVESLAQTAVDMEVAESRGHVAAARVHHDCPLGDPAAAHPPDPPAGAFDHGAGHEAVGQDHGGTGSSRMGRVSITASQPGYCDGSRDRRGSSVRTATAANRTPTRYATTF